MLILLPRRTVAVRVDFRLEIELDKVVPSELPKLESLEEEMKAKSRERVLKPTGPGELTSKSILQAGRETVKRCDPNERISVCRLHSVPRRAYTQ